MTPSLVIEFVQLASALAAASVASSVLLYRRYRLEMEALQEINRFMRENPGLVAKGGDGFLERWVVTNYISNSFGLTRSHYSRRVEDMKEFVTASAREMDGQALPDQSFDRLPDMM